MHPSIRNRISNSDGRIELGRDIEIKPENSYACLDQEMVDDSNNYVIVQGLKFMSLKICFRYNYSMSRKKHNRMDLLLIVRYVLNI